jgi:hypothetical protein
MHALSLSHLPCVRCVVEADAVALLLLELVDLIILQHHVGPPVFPQYQIPVPMHPYPYVQQPLQAPAPLVPAIRTDIPGVPCAPPTSEQDAGQRIEKLAEYVARNEREGKDFESIVKQKEQGNPVFAFLFGGEHSKFYQWALFCARRGYGKEEAQLLLQSHQQVVEACAPGTLDMTHEESKEFNALLESNRGTAKDVKTLRLWILERAHCATAAGVLMRRYVIQSAAGRSPKVVCHDSWSVVGI